MQNNFIYRESVAIVTINWTDQKIVNTLPLMKKTSELRRRNMRICRMYYRDGISMPRIAAVMGLTRQRVFAILRKYGEAIND